MTRTPDPPPPSSAAPTIPLVDQTGRDPSHLAVVEAERARALLAAGREKLGGPALRAMERLSRHWSERALSPYHDEIAASAAVLPLGVWFMNYSYEWGCSTGLDRDPAGGAPRLRRTLDWPYPAIGRTAVVAKADGGAGPYYNVTWPGFHGVVTAMAPGRFAVAINQAPLIRRAGLTRLGSWAVQRMRLWHRTALAPAQLLRRVFDSAPDFATARRVLSETPVALPVIYCLSGIEPGECAIVERLADAARAIDGPGAATNQWQAITPQGYDRGNDSPGRLAAMRRALGDADDAFGWLRAPILNRDTRLAVAANAARGTLAVQGWEDEAPVTALFRLSGQGDLSPQAQ